MGFAEHNVQSYRFSAKPSADQVKTFRRALIRPEMCRYSRGLFKMPSDVERTRRNRKLEHFCAEQGNRGCDCVGGIPNEEATSIASISVIIFAFSTYRT